MNTTMEILDPRFFIVQTSANGRRDEFARDVRQGLTASPKHLPCRYFYDREGSLLFEAICALPEYYLTRAEHSILEREAKAIVERLPAGVTLVELGSGSAAKTRLVIEALLRSGRRLRYVPIDISPTMLEESSWALLADYQNLEITAIAGEYHDGLDLLQRESDSPRLVLWLGSNIGNLRRGAATEFLARVRAALDPADRVLCGIDLRKDRLVLERAYDDAEGVTAEFNRNVLARINRELGGHFDVASFRHRAVYDEDEGRVAMYLVSMRAQRVRIEALGLEVPFAAGEAIHTEDSFKYSPEEIEDLAARAGLAVDAQWLDTARQFSVNLFAPIG